MKAQASLLAILLLVVLPACSGSAPTGLRSSEPSVRVANDRAGAGEKKTDESRHLSGEFISEQIALKLAQEIDVKVTWGATFEPELFFREENGRMISCPTWRVEAIYPAGNRVIIYFDAVTAERLEVFEAPAGSRKSDGK